jgi:predicted nuclease with TOPRIM domain
VSDIDFKNTLKYIEAMQSRNWQQCDLIADEHKALVEIIKQLEQENAKLKERLKDAENVIEFYAKTSVWGIGLPSEQTSIDPCDVENLFHQEIGITSRGGKKAREYFKK